MVQWTQGTQLNCFALNCVVLDASFSGGRTDMRTPPQHTHQYIRHKHHSSRRTTAEGKFCITVHHIHNPLFVCVENISRQWKVLIGAPHSNATKNKGLYLAVSWSFSIPLRFNTMFCKCNTVLSLTLGYNLWSFSATQLQASFFFRWQIIVFCVHYRTVEHQLILAKSENIFVVRLLMAPEDRRGRTWCAFEHGSV